MTLSTVPIYAALLRAGLRSQLEYRFNFLIWVVMGIVYQTTGFVFIWVVLTRFEALAGWSLGEVTFLYGLRLLGHAVNILLFGYLHLIETHVREGHFDRFLVRPLPALLQVIVWRFPVGAIGDLIGGLVLFAAASRLVSIDWSPLAIAFVGLTVLGAALIEAGLKLLVASLCFRFLSTRSLVFVVDDIFSNFGNYPLKIFGGMVQFLLTFGIPVAFIAYLPATVLLARTDELSISPVFAYLAPLGGVAVFALAYLVWKRELPHYQSAGH
jgi:ABC-2 type transport system permease protein